MPKLLSPDEVLSLKTPEALRNQLCHKCLADRLITPAEVVHLHQIHGLCWKYSGNPKHFHIGLPSGLHCEEYLHFAELTRWGYIAHLFADQMVQVLRQHYKGGVDIVLTPDDSTSIGVMLADILRARHVATRQTGYGQSWIGGIVLAGERILLAEGMTMTGRTLAETKSAALHGNGCGLQFLPFALSFAGWKEQTALESLVKVIDLPFSPNHAVDCPHCVNGSVALWPKPNWPQLRYQMTGG